jgi:hypothetical protein
MLISKLLAAAEEVLKEYWGRLKKAERKSLAELAAESAANYIWMCAPLLKNPSFAAEDEWRLITYEPRGEGVPENTRVMSPTEFRDVSGRIVPYKKLKFDVLPAVEIVLGSSAPMEPDELPLVVLMEETLGTQLEVRTSAVTLRP